MNYTAMAAFPPVSRDPQDILRLFGPESEAAQKAAQRALGVRRPILGNDLEFVERQRYVEEPTILGVSDGALSVSVPFAEGLPYFQELVRRHPDILYVGHFFISADLFAFRQAGINIEVKDVCDTSIWHYLTAMNLCKGTGKVEDQDGERRGKGYMNLWSFISLHTSLGNWKECKGKECDGTYCPEHEPFGYNGVDSIAPVLALPSVVRTGRLRQVDHLYDLHANLTYELAEMTRYGIQVDVPYVEQLKQEFIEAKEAIAKQLPFSPTSPQQIVDHFKKKDIKLPNAQEATIRETLEDVWDEELALVLEFKELGNGTDRWFAPIHKKPNGEWEGFMDAAGRVHPRLILFTSSGRLACVSPNFQNVLKRRVDRYTCTCTHKANQHQDVEGKKLCSVPGCTCIAFTPMNMGKKVRRAVIGSDGTYLVDADYKNGENRVYLYLAGYEPPEEDFHDWMTGNIGIDNAHPFAMAHGSAREAAKTATHSTDYGEGIKLCSDTELRSVRIKKEIDEGARTVFWDWKFQGKTVTFTGINMARRAFGEASFENRRAALEIAERYMARFPRIRDLQRRITAQVEKEGMARPPHGYATPLYGDAEEKLKSALAIWGSQPIAHLSKLAIVSLGRKFRVGQSPIRPLLQVHDELLGEVERGVAPAEAMTLLKQEMEIRTAEMPGMLIPADPSYGPNWRDLKKVKA